MGFVTMSQKLLDEQCVSAKEMAQRLGCTVTTLYNCQDLPYFTVGKRKRVYPLKKVWAHLNKQDELRRRLLAPADKTKPRHRNALYA